MERMEFEEGKVEPNLMGECFTELFRSGKGLSFRCQAQAPGGGGFELVSALGE